MTPSKTSLKISASATGVSSDQTINPSELNLWRIVKINNDGTIEMVSEYVSSTAISFYGKTGYLNYVGVLNAIAAGYKNEKYTLNARCMGYGGQSPIILDESKITTTAPWTTSTADNNNEMQGGGDYNLHYTDYFLVKDLYGSVIANKVGTTTAAKYWVSSRAYVYSNDTYYYFAGREVETNGSLDRPGMYLYSNQKFYSYQQEGSIRPMVTLKSGITASSGSGTSSSPWVLN